MPAQEARSRMVASTVLVLMIALMPKSAFSASTGVYYGVNETGMKYEALLVMAATADSDELFRVVFATDPSTGSSDLPDLFIDGIVPLTEGKGMSIFRNVPDNTRCMGFFDVTFKPLGSGECEVTVVGSGERWKSVDFKARMRRLVW